MAEQVELTLQQSQRVATGWGIRCDADLALLPAKAGCPATYSPDYPKLVGWTLIGVNGHAVATRQDAAMRLGIAKPGDVMTIHCRKPGSSVTLGQPEPAPAPTAMAPPGPPAPPPQTCRLRINNLSRAVQTSDLEQLFAQFGRIVDVHIPSKANNFYGGKGGKGGKGGAKGSKNGVFGFVEFASEAEGQRAIQTLNGQMLMKMPISVTIAEGRRQSRAEMMVKRDPRYSEMKDAVPDSNSGTRKCYNCGGDHMARQCDMSGPGENPMKRRRAHHDDSEDGGAGLMAAHMLKEDLDAIRAAGPEPPPGSAEAVQLRKACNSLESLRQELARERIDKEKLQLQIMQLQQEKGLSGASDDVVKKVEKYKSKLEKYREAEQNRAKAEVDKKKAALTSGVERCSDEEVHVLSKQMGTLTVADAYAVLGLTHGADDQGHAKKLMAKLHPDRVAVEACKDGLRMRFQLAQHCRDLLAAERAPPPTPAAPAAAAAGVVALADDDDDGCAA